MSASRNTLHGFQRDAVYTILGYLDDAAAAGSRRANESRVIALTAPTGSGKTIIMAALIESIVRGVAFADAVYDEQPQAVFLWLSDSPELNRQSREKIAVWCGEGIARRMREIDETFDQRILEDGHIYFLNTQKLGSKSRLVRAGDRNHTIWQTLAATVREKAGQLYVIIDEAHRGMQGGAKMREATTIMQKFLLGSPPDGLPPMPLVLGMSATIERFDAFMGKTRAITYPTVEVDIDAVRRSGLLKDKIRIKYPENGGVNIGLSVLRAAAEDWLDKCARWQAHCEQFRGGQQVRPVLIVQVENRAGDEASATSLGECMQEIEKAAGRRFARGEAVHAFGDKSTLVANGLEIAYQEPSTIEGDPHVRIVFFKEGLVTGWDCPRAETLMSFRRAVDATHIAQLLGRMVRTPLHQRIASDEVLNDVKLFLPYFDKAAVEKVVAALKSREEASVGDIEGEAIEKPEREVLTVVHTSVPAAATTLAQQQQGGSGAQQVHSGAAAGAAPFTLHAEGEGAPHAAPAAAQASATAPSVAAQPAPRGHGGGGQVAAMPAGTAAPAPRRPQPVPGTFDRVQVLDFINRAGLICWEMERKKINDYLTSLFALAHLLVQAGLKDDAAELVTQAIVEKLSEYIRTLKDTGEYEALAEKIRKFKLLTVTVDAFGHTIIDGLDDDGGTPDFFAAEKDIERQLRATNKRLASDSVYKMWALRLQQEGSADDPRIDVILYAGNTGCRDALHAWARQEFHRLRDAWRLPVLRCSGALAWKVQQDFKEIVRDGDEASPQTFQLPTTIVSPPVKEGSKRYASHLFAHAGRGDARISLNDWEEAVIAEEEKRPDFVCWLRNDNKAPWRLRVLYEKDANVQDVFAPDFIIVRREPHIGYVIDILEPHGAQYSDNLPKAQGLARYAQECLRQDDATPLGRVQMIRKDRDAAGGARLNRLDLMDSGVRAAVLAVQNEAAWSALFK